MVPDLISSAGDKSLRPPEGPGDYAPAPTAHHPRVLIAALEAAANGIVISDRNGHIVWVNAAFTALTGYTRQEAIGRSPRLLKSGNHDAAFYQHLWSTILSGQVWHGEMVNRRKDGSLYTEEMTITPVCDSYGEVQHFIAIKQDITARKLGEAALRRSENRYRSLANSLPELFVETDLAGNITFASANTLRVTGYGSSDLEAGLNMLDLVAPHDRDRLLRDFAEVMSGRANPPFEYDARRKDGTTFPILVSPSAIIEDNKPSGGRAIAVDITERKRAEEALRLTQFSVDHAADSVVWVEADGSVFYANDAACRALGYSRAELLSMKVQDFDPDYGDDVWPTHWAALRLAGSLRFEVRHRRKDGSIFPVEVTASYARFAGKEYGFSFAHDISVRKKAEEALAEQKYLFDILMNSLPDRIYFKDRNGRFLRVGQTTAKVFGLRDPGEAVGKTDFDFFTGAHPQQAYQVEQQIIRTGQPAVDVEEKETWPDGRVTWLSSTKMPLHDPSGRIIGTFGISRDITAGKSAQEALHASEEFNKRVIESSFDGVCVLDPQGSLLYMSPGGRRLFELGDDDDLLQQPWIGFWEGIDAQKTRHALDTALEGGIGAYQGGFRTRKGTFKFWDIVISPITGAHGDVERLVCIFRDITARRQLESQLAQAQKLESIGQLAAGIAHEINTPIQYVGDNGIFLQEAFQELMRAVGSSREPDTRSMDGSPAAEDPGIDYLREEIPKAIAQLLEGVQHVTRIVRAMKEFSHPGPVEKALVDIRRAIESTVLVSRNEWKYVADLTTDFDPQLTRVYCIAGEFNQVLLNLIVNAAHAISDVVKDSGRKGSIHVSTRRNGDWAEIRVSDTGSGIPEPIQAKVFDPFFTTKPVGKGSGQGLSIAHSVIVQKHRGKISFESAAGAGTTFLIQLPLECETEVIA